LENELSSSLVWLEKVTAWVEGKFKDCTSELGVFLSDNYKHLQKALN
jgi:hypothetical protein